MNDPIPLAGCIILDDYDRILLIHRNTNQFQHWELPGGKVEEGETADLAAIRELREELGVEVQVVKALGSEQLEDANGVFKYYWFQAKISTGNPAVQEMNKFDDVAYFELEDLPSLSLSANMLILEEKLLSGEVSLQP